VLVLGEVVHGVHGQSGRWYCDLNHFAGRGADDAAEGHFAASAGDAEVVEFAGAAGLAASAAVAAATDCAGEWVWESEKLVLQLNV
jgi:hypothetical protein